MIQLRKLLVRACIEIAFIIFLFYANLLMGEFTARSGVGKGWAEGFSDILTARNFGIALVSSAVGFVFFEALRKRLQD